TVAGRYDSSCANHSPERPPTSSYVEWITAACTERVADGLDQHGERGLPATAASGRVASRKVMSPATSMPVAGDMTWYWPMPAPPRQRPGHRRHTSNDEPRQAMRWTVSLRGRAA